MKKILLLLLTVLVFSGCEKDDICTEETTPKLVLEFYDISNPTVLRNVINLKAVGEKTNGTLMDNGVVFNEDGTDVTKYLTNESKVKLPLRTDGDVTRYHLYLNSTSTSGGINEDIIEVNYTRQTVFVSRACGYKVTFDLNSGNGIVHTDATTPDLVWIKDINILTNSINTENEVHLKILF